MRSGEGAAPNSPVRGGSASVAKTEFWATEVAKGPLRGGQGDGDESRSHEPLQPAGAGAGLRPDPDLDREPGEDSVVVVRRNQEAGDHQLSHLQARTRRAVLRSHLRADQGL